MGITLVTGPANSGKAQVVMDAVRRHLAHGREPLLIVPTATDVEHYLRELAGTEAAMGVRVERFSGLIEELVARAGVDEPVLGGLARERVLALLAADPGSSPGFLRALGELFADLQVRRVSPARLTGALRDAFGSEPQPLGFDLARLYSEYHRRLERLGRLDQEQRALHALDRLREAPALWGATPVLFYGFDDLTRQQLDAIETLGGVVDADVTVSLAYERGRTAFAGRASTFETLAPLAREHTSLPPRAQHYAPGSRAALSHLERSLFEPGAPRADPAGAIELLQGGGERAELELIAGRVAALLRSGMPAQEIAVVVRHPAAVAALLAEIFTAAAIPFAMPLKRPFGDTAVGRALIGLLRCVPRADGSIDGTAADLLAWLRAPGRLDRPQLADALERELRRDGVTTVAEARERWQRRWFALDTIDHLAAAQARGPAALAERAGRELLWLFSAPRRGRASVLSSEEMDEARALAGGRSALAELRELVRLAPDAAPSSAAELALVLAGLQVNSGALPGPGLVAVLDPLALRARRVRALFLAGMQEGEFPSRARPQPLLGDRERTRIAKASGLLLGEPVDVLAGERYLLYALLSRPEQQLTLSWHETDDDAGPLSRSLFVDDVCDLFDERLQDERERRALGAVEGTGAASRPELVAGGRLTDEHVLAGLRERPWSGTSIEKWISCPVAWFVERLLAPDRFEPDPEPLARGGLAHLVLKETLEELRLETGSGRVTAGNLERARELMRAALARAAADPEHRLSASPARTSAILRALSADIERYLGHAAEQDGSLVPYRLELGFGFGEDDPQSGGEAPELPAFELGGGVRMRGRIDRVDVGADGGAVVIDYKAKTARAGEKWIERGDLQVALYMQAVEQLLGLDVVGGLYQPLTGKDIRARGVLLDGHDSAGNCVRTDRLEAEALDELLAEALDSARTAAGEARAGRLEPRPESCGYGGRGCRYPTICRCER